MLEASRTKATGKKVVGGAGIVAIAVALAVGSLRTDEGKRNVGYLDIAKIPTDCFGHTGADVHVGQRKSDEQCEGELAGDARIHMMGALHCTPILADKPNQLAAATRLTFNIGVAAYCGSTIARRFNAGDLRGGCDAFLAWDKARVGGRTVVVNGLELRRQRERAMCLEDLS